MAEKIVIDVFKEKNASDFTAALADPDGRAQGGSAAAYTAAMACALSQRVAQRCAKSVPGERIDYIARNCGILRDYMVHLIDEEVKSRRPYLRAVKQGGEREVEATIQTAACIDAEIINMMKPLLEFILELCDQCSEEEKVYLAQAAELAVCACKVSRNTVLAFGDKSTDEIYRYVTKRENEVFLSERTALYDSVLSKLGV